LKELLFHAALYNPYSIAIDAADNIFFSDLTNKIKRITHKEVIAIAGGLGSSTWDPLSVPLSVPYISQFDRDGNLLIASKNGILLLKNISIISKVKIIRDFEELMLLNTNLAKVNCNITGKIFHLHIDICMARCGSFINFIIYHPGKTLFTNNKIFWLRFRCNHFM